MKKVLFVCVENSCRSQMADGFARVLGKGKVESYSAGSRPGGSVNADAVRVMKEIGIDISGQRSKGFYDLGVKEFDYVITMGCKDTCPFVPAKKHIDWQIEDPKGKGEDFFRKTRELIKEKVEQLIIHLLER
ncbi:MAG: arsenate reductase ArsC [Candidatus Omnitrophica bacterium]|nr:arsenate reductase ArsC [Candidatus Omnitrophota bacterium]